MTFGAVLLLVRDCAPLDYLPNEPFAIFNPLPFKGIRGLHRHGLPYPRLKHKDEDDIIGNCFLSYCATAT